MLLLAMVLGESRVNPGAPRSGRGVRADSRPRPDRITDPVTSNAPDQLPTLVRWNVIRALGFTGSDSSDTRPMEPSRESSLEPLVRLTIWLPRHMIPEKGEHRPGKKSSGASSNSPRKNTVLRRPDSIQLWLNKTSKTEVRLGSPIDRSMVHIYGQFFILIYLLLKSVHIPIKCFSALK